MLVRTRVSDVKRPRPTRACCALAALLVLCSALTISSAAQGQNPVESLVAGASIDTTLAAGASHAFRLELTTGQYASLSVLQQGIDVAVVVLGPDGAMLADVDGPTGKYGSERVRLVAAAAGTYRVEVRSLEKGTP